jgi:hypothetical protein
MRFWQRLETEHIERCAGNVAGLDEVNKSGSFSISPRTLIR